jgi:alkylhydroperoxidase family enzyme
VLAEQVVDEIRDDWVDSAGLMPDQKAVLGLTDALLAGDEALTPALRSELEAHFSPAQIVELTAGIALFMGFSKIAIALGGVPDEMPVMLSAVPGR